MKHTHIALSLLALMLATLPTERVFANSEPALKSGTVADAINSITLVDSFVVPPVTIGDLRATVFSITFSIQAFKDSITIPLRAGIINPATLRKSAPQISFRADSRYGSVSTQNTPLYAVLVVPEIAATSDQLYIKAGTKGEMTLLIAYAAKPEHDREDRIKVTGMPLYFGTSTTPVILNPSEVSELRTHYIELAE